MNRLAHFAPMDVTPYAELPIDHRTGPSLSQGFLLSMIGTVAADQCSAATLEVIDQTEPTTWYHGQLLENVLNEFEDRQADLPADIGKNIYYLLRSQFVAAGIRTPADVINTLPMLWQQVTRGDSGEWRTQMLGPTTARLEAEQPYNCLFEAGAVQGALESFGATRVEITHDQCMRDAAPFCVFNVTWQEA